MKRLGLAFAAPGLAACATLPPPQPSALDLGLLIARVEIHGALSRSLTYRADSAQIVALAAAGVPVPGQRAQSGLAVNGYVLFFGMPAGRYVLRAASFPARGVRYRLAVPEDGQAKRAVVLRPGAAAYLLFGSLEGLTLLAKSLRHVAPLEKGFRQVLLLLCDGRKV